MKLSISHTTSYHYDAPVPYALQQLRLRPKSRPNQLVLNWEVQIEGGERQLSFEDEHANTVDLISFHPGASEIVVRCMGEVDITDTAGVMGKHTGFVPLWLFERSTPLTTVGPQIRNLVASVERLSDPLAQLHALSEHVLQVAPYSTRQKSAELSAEEVLSAGYGVCQDHAHVFITAARAMGFPARYVSGYLMMNDRVDQNASHAWAEAYVENLGWVGFDISNAICPDARYVKVATGMDYLGAAPVSGMRYGGSTENMLVKLQVEQQ